MRVFADRFLLDDGDAVDLATGETVRLLLDRCPSVAAIRERTDLCDHLSMLRHPLLIPLVDYGTAEDTWFEAHVAWSPLKTGAAGSRLLALHLIRFLRAHRIELSASTCARHVRAAIERANAVSPPPLAWRLAWRAAVDAVRLTIESGGPPGVTLVTLSGAVGSGLRSARLMLARAARVSGFVVVDSRFPLLLPHLRERHCCVLDWLPAATELPALLAHAATSGTSRHVWLRFTRQPARGTCALPLDPLSPAEMETMLYRDAENGPDENELRVAIQESRGWPGSLLQRLAAARSPAPVLMVHETAPRYAVLPPESRSSHPDNSDQANGGVRRLVRVLQAAEHVAERGRHARAERLLRRSIDALAARGATAAAARGSLTLGDLLLRRGQPAAALAAYGRARDLLGADVRPRLLLTLGRAHALNGSRLEAEAVFRTALADGDPAVRSEAAARMADLLVRGDECEKAIELLRAHGADSTPLGRLVLSHIHFRTGDLAQAAACARAVLGAAISADLACEAHVVLARLLHAMGEHGPAKDAVRNAMSSAKQARDRGLQWLAWGARTMLECSSSRGAARKRRLLAVAPGLPAARADDVRALFSTSRGARQESPAPEAALFETLLGLTEAAPDEERAVSAVLRHVLDHLGACTTAAWTADQGRQVAMQGRPWSGSGIARLTLNSGQASFAPGVVTEAAEPVRAGGRTIGCLSARWPGGRAPSESRARTMLRLAAAAIAPAIAALNAPSPAVPARHDAPDALLGDGPCAERLRALIVRAAGAPFPVLIEGESGSGKELVARAVHARSVRRGRRCCAVNCAALSEDLLEAELFGHARGAFTGAASERAGLFEEADQGTLFLDEVGELSARAQAKLLRVLQEGEVRRLGENLPRRVDVRIVAATNRPLEGEVEAGRFRADLRFRLDVVRIVVPPLRERADEIPALAERIWREAAARVGTRATLAPDLVLALARYPWPGNVRELQNVLAALAVHAPARGRVPASLLPARIAEMATRSTIAFDQARSEFERRFIQAALARAAGRKGVAAAQLGISRQGLDKMLKRLGIAGRRTTAGRTVEGGA